MSWRDPETELDRLLVDEGLARELARHEARLDEIGECRPESSPRPFLCPAAQEPVFARICDVLHRAIERVSALYFGRTRGGAEPFADLVPIPPHLVGVVHDRHGYAGTNVFCRFDVHVDRHGAVRVLELNCADPSAIAWHDWMMRAVTSTRAFERLRADRDVRWRELVPLHWEVVRRCHRERGGDEGHVAFAIADGSSVHFDFAAFARLYRELGIDAAVYDPSRFSLEEGGRLVAGAGRRDVAIVVRDTLDEVVPPDASWEPTRALRTALGESLVSFVNPTSAVLADQKALLEVLSAPQWSHLFEPYDRAVLAEILPWTRVLRPGRTEHDGRTIDLVPWVLEHGRELVLKPSEGYGGFGVTIGVAVGEPVWRERVAEALASTRAFVVQRHVEAAAFRAPPRVGDAGAARRRVPFNLSLWSFAGRFVGGIARASLGAVVNVHQGGILLPLVFCD